jgi:hypothetical protein
MPRFRVSNTSPLLWHATYLNSPAESRAEGLPNAGLPIHRWSKSATTKPIVGPTTIRVATAAHFVTSRTLPDMKCALSAYRPAHNARWHNFARNYAISPEVGKEVTDAHVVAHRRTL